MDEIINQTPPIIEPIPTVVPKKKLSIWVWLISIIFIFLLNIIFKQQQLLNSNKKEISENIVPTTEPTQIPTNQPIPTMVISYKATSVQDDKNSVSKLILTDQNNNETIIVEEKYGNMGDDLIIKPSFNNFIFSPDNNFLYFFIYNGWEGGISVLYDIKNKKEIDLDFSAETAGFTPDSKYFYACGEGGLDAGGAVLKQLPQLNNIFSSTEITSMYTCQYNQDTREILFTESNYNNNNEKVVISQHKFSQESGSITKIK